MQDWGWASLLVQGWEENNFFLLQACVDRNGQHHGGGVYKLLGWYPLLSHVTTRLTLLRAIHILGDLNLAEDSLSHRLCSAESGDTIPKVDQLIWSRFGEAQVNLFSSKESSQCPLYSLTEAPGRTGTQVRVSPVSLITQTLCKIREEEEQVLKVAPYWPNQTWFSEFRLMTSAPPW